MTYQKLSKWAKDNSYTYRGAYGLFRKGQIPGAKTLESGAIVVPKEENVKGKYQVLNKEDLIQDFISLTTDFLRKTL